MSTDLFAAANDPVLEGVIERFVYVNPDTGWSVASLKPRRGEAVVVIGPLSGLRPGESARLEGAWETDSRFGRQFRVRTFRSMPPSTPEAIEKYLGSGLVRGIGPVLAKRLVQHFQEETLEVLDRFPGRLREVHGLGSARQSAIRAAWKEQRDLKELVMFLQAHGLGPGVAQRLFRTYGARAVEILSHDPYRLAHDIAGIGFRSADRIAQAVGLPHDARVRLEAALLHVLDNAAEAGHCFLPRQELVQRTTRLLTSATPSPDAAPAASPTIEVAALEAVIDALATAGAFVQEAHATGVAVYAPRLHDLEVRVAAALHARAAAAAAIAPAAAVTTAATAPTAAAHAAAATPAVAEYEARAAVTLSPSQRTALQAALGTRLLVITGGPGTGKTTLVRALLDIFQRQRLRGVLCAPTGRAAKRLAAAAGQDASTIHRLLEWNPRTAHFQRDAQRPLDGDVFIVDETSMVDLPLLHHLLQALPPQSRLLCVGDSDQLPSVGPGALLGDMIASECVPTVELTELFRQEAESLIVHNAHRIRRGEPPHLPPPGQRADFVLVERDTPEAVLVALRQLVCARLPESLGADPRTDIQVLVPMHRGALGTQALNTALQDWLNPRGAPVGTTRFRVGDKVMQIRNDYDLDVFNGDVGVIDDMDAEDRRVVVRFDDRRVTYGFDALDALALAYALSVHKSQGSEYPVVVLVLHSQHHVMLQRNLLYTAVTRARQQVVLVGQRRALHVALGNARRLERHTHLAERLRALRGR